MIKVKLLRRIEEGKYAVKFIVHGEGLFFNKINGLYEERFDGKNGYYLTISTEVKRPARLYRKLEKQIDDASKQLMSEIYCLVHPNEYPPEFDDEDTIVGRC